MDNKEKLEEVQRKAQALLNMIEHPNSNENEIANATNILHKMLAKYQMDISEIKNGDIEVGEIVDTLVVNLGKKSHSSIETWLITALAENFDCHLILRKEWKKATYLVIGHDSDRLFVKFLFESIMRGLQTQAKKKLKEWEVPQDKSLKFRNSFFIGAVTVIDTRLRSQKKTVQSDCTSLVVVKTDAVEKFVKNQFHNLKEKTTNLSPRIDDIGYALGREEGNKVSLNRPIGCDPDSNKHFQLS